MTLMLLILGVFTVTLVSWLLLDLHEQLVRRPVRPPLGRPVRSRRPLRQH